MRPFLWVALTLVAVCHCGEFKTPIKHVVLLMEENRSFDHMLGWLKKINPAIDGLTGNEFNRRDPKDESSPKRFVSPNATYIAPFDPGHSISQTTGEIWGPPPRDNTTAPMQGFIWQHVQQHKEPAGSVMDGFPHERVPIITTLAQDGANFDRFYAAVPGPTQPNRMYCHSATSHGLGDDDKNRLIEGMPQKTIYESLDEAGHDWRIFFRDATAVVEFLRLREPQNLARIQPFDLFLESARLGTLPAYTFLAPRYFASKDGGAEDQHPVHDVRSGEVLMKKIYEALRASPKWNETALIVTYDEHGGFYDHVPTPLKDVPSPDGLSWHGFDFNRGGVRIPFIVVSPWVDAQIVHEPTGTQKPTPSSHFDLSSVPGTLKKMFGLKDFLTKRDAWAGTFDDIFMQRKTPRTDLPKKLPAAPTLPENWIERELQLPPSDLQLEFARIAAALNDPRIAQGGLPPTFDTQSELRDYTRTHLMQFWEKQGVAWPFPE